jgi:hypothetical protein
MQASLGLQFGQFLLKRQKHIVYINKVRDVTLLYGDSEDTVWNADDKTQIYKTLNSRQLSYAACDVFAGDK